MGRASRAKQERRQSGEGDCYEAAGRLLLKTPTSARAMVRLCHGIVTGNAAPLTGKRFGHAWVEMGGYVLDYSNGQQTRTTVERYYAMASVRPSEVVRYDWLQGATAMVQTGHFGPWEG